MGKEFASWSLLLHLLLLMCTHGNGAREMNEKHNTFLRLPSMDADIKKLDVDVHPSSTHAEPQNDAPHDHQMMHSEHVHANPSSHMNHMNRPVLSIFFTLKDLKQGKTTPIYFPKLDPSSPRFLPKEIAESIPFSSKELPRLLQLLSFSEGSPQATKIEETLRICEAKPGSGETKFCATSLESLIDFVRGMFGTESHFQVLTTDHLTQSKTIFQNYTIREMPKEMTVPRVVPCHPIAYPYAVFYCHFLTETKTFKISLEGENGDRIEAVAACHMNTSEWDPNHVAFRVLGTKPGSSEICHYFPADNLLWVPHVHA